jgi:hypothetical protein
MSMGKRNIHYQVLKLNMKVDENAREWKDLIFS